MRKTAFTLVLFAFCALSLAWTAMGSDGNEPQDLAAAPALESRESVSETVSDEPAMELQAVAATSDSVSLSQVLKLASTTSWNCGGCIEPSSCQTHADCGFPQGRCIQGTCRCICDPYVW